MNPGSTGELFFEFFRENPVCVSYKPPKLFEFILVSHPGKGGCADPVNEDAILEGVGGRPPGRNRERQLASDTGDGKT